MEPHNHERLIELSLAPKEYSGKETHYVPTAVSISSLEQIFKTHNYSPIHWAGPYRATSNFIRGVGFCPDIDGKLSIPEAIKRLRANNLNFALITTRSHTKENHRYRLFIPFNYRLHSYESYYKAANELNKILGGNCDPKVFDGARQLFGSPDDAEYYCNWSGNDFDVSNLIGIDFSEEKYPLGDWDEKTELKTSKNLIVHVKDIERHTPIYCPFHDDASPSAFVDFAKSSSNWFIHCSSCNKTYWKTKVMPSLKTRCANYWSHGKEVFEFGASGGAFFMSSIGKEKFLMFVTTHDKKYRAQAYQYLIDNKHIKHIKVVNHISDMKAAEPSYEVAMSEGTITVHYPPVPVKTKDNAFIEDYLGKTFGTYKGFIKEWLAVYCYTNYLDLPTLILKGGRGNGKNTFAEMVYGIFPTISQMWEAERRNFTPEAEKKLLIADETVCDDPEQYKLLKQYAGSKYASVNKKYLPPYEVQNNMNIIILSNSEIPVYVSRDEKPTSEENNQFFVFDFKPFNGPIDPEMDQKLEDRIGYYVRTELKTVFDSINFNGNRYSIKTPITPEEAGLFESNVTEAEAVAEKIIDKASAAGNEYAKFLAAGWFPTAIVDDSVLSGKIGARKVIKTLQEQGYLKMQDTVKKQIDNSPRVRCYQMTDKLKKLIET